MRENSQGRLSGRKKLWLALSAVAVILALLIVPPFISIRRYQNRVTQLVSASVGRPVRLSSVELRILPRPSFVLTDLVVEEDPAYGAEPILHANAVTASIRLLPLWRGKLEISRISVDEASLNLVRAGDGRWNLDPFFRTATANAMADGAHGGAIPFPYLEATNSRVNIKNGVEKLPYSLVNADLSFWQDDPGDWRIRLRGQPARTDVSLDLPDTGILRLEGRLRRAPELRQMPIHFDVDWREAQLGQLTRLLVGSDEGWRGDLTGEIHVDGIADSAQVKARLRASGVHRVEFAPASPMDFDATCAFVYHYTVRGMEKLLCDSPVGDGRARITGDVPGHNQEPHLTLELDRVPAQAALDALRTVRSQFDPSLQATGAVSGKISYAPVEKLDDPPAPPPTGKANGKTAKPHAPAPGPLTGSLIVSNLRVSGDNLSRPVLVPKITVEPAPGQQAAFSTSFAIPAGGPGPLNFAARVSRVGYQVGLHGVAALPRLREFAHVAGIQNVAVLDKLTGQPATIDLTAQGPWLVAPPPLPMSSLPGSSAAPPLVAAATDRMTGTLTLRGATWRGDFLANPVEITEATLHLDDGAVRWDPVAFSYGPVRGTATLNLPARCEVPEKCPPQFTLRFGSLDTAALQAALLGARRPGTLMSSLLSRFKPSSTPEWPDLEGTVQADSLILGPVILNGANADLRIDSGGAEIKSFAANVLGGQLQAEGSVTPGTKPDYKLRGQFKQINPADLGRLFGMAWSGNALDGAGEIELAGFRDNDLATSAKGSLHFDWRHGSIADKGVRDVPAALARFDRWTADAEIANGTITLKQNQVQHGHRKLAVEASATFGAPPRVSFGQPQEARAAKR